MATSVYGPDPGREADELLLEILRRYEAGESMASIARALGFKTYQSVQQRIKPLLSILEELDKK